MTQQTPTTNVQQASTLGSQELPGVVFNNAPSGTVNVQVFTGDEQPVRGFMAPDASSAKLDQQIAAMQQLGLVPDTTGMAMDSARADAGIEMPIPSTVGKFTQKLQDQQMEALSHAPEGPAQG